MSNVKLQVIAEIHHHLLNGSGLKTNVGQGYW